MLAIAIVSVTKSAAANKPQFTSVDSLTALLTIETLLFTAFQVALGLSVPAGNRLRLKPRQLAIATAAILAVIAGGALIAWFDTFLGNWPSGWYGVFPVVCIAIGIVVQPPIVWLVARDVDRGHTEIGPRNKPTEIGPVRNTGGA